MAVKKSPPPETEKATQEARTGLTPGTHYTFEPAVAATGMPTSGADACPKADRSMILTFQRGMYVGFVKKKHLFQGKPNKDRRRIDPARRECYFVVDFNSGVLAFPAAKKQPLAA